MSAFPDDLSVRLEGSDEGFPWTTVLPLITAVLVVALTFLYQVFLMRKQRESEKERYLLTEKRKVYAELIAAANRAAESCRDRAMAEYKETDDERKEARDATTAEITRRLKEYDEARVEVQFLVSDSVFTSFKEKEDEILKKPAGTSNVASRNLSFADQWRELASAILNLGRKDMGVAARPRTAGQIDGTGQGGDA